MKTFIPIISKLSKASRTRHHLHPYRGCGGPCCQLRFNAANCKVPHLRQNNRKHVYNMKTHGTRERVSIGPSIMEMDLGVLVDTDLQFSKHVEEQVNKANGTLGLIRRSFQFFNRESLKLLFTVLVRPHLEFGYVAWAPRYQKDRLLIKGVLRRPTKIAHGLRDLD